MIELTQTDRKLLALLRQDARVSVTTLAGALSVSRATVQSRLDRLVQNGIIQRFTIDVDASVDAELVRAIMMIELQGELSNSVIAALGRIREISSLHTTNGNWDLIAQIEAYSLPEFDKVLRQVRQISGVLNSETNILLNTAQNRSR